MPTPFAIGRRRAATAGLILLAAVAGCRRASPTRADGIVSLSPAATSILLALGAGDRLVGVSNFDRDARVADVPRVGDYETIDWERLAALRPQTMIVQAAPERLPPGFGERARRANCGVTSIHIDRLEDIDAAIRTIGAAIGRDAAADELRESIAKRFRALHDRTPARRAKVLLALSDNGLFVAGVQTFLDDALVAAGGTNAMGSTAGYTSIDRERLGAIETDVVVFLLPLADESAMSAARELIAGLPGAPRRVAFVVRADVLQPNDRVIETAERLAAILRGDASPTTEPAR